MTLTPDELFSMMKLAAGNAVKHHGIDTIDAIPDPEIALDALASLRLTFYPSNSGVMDEIDNIRDYLENLQTLRLNGQSSAS